MDDRLCSLWRPRFVVSGRGGAAPLTQQGALRAVGPGSAGHVGHVRLFPRTRHIVLRRWRRVDLVVHPAVPSGRNHRSLGIVRIDDPAPVEAQRRVRHSAPRAVVDVAELILADTLSPPPRVEESSHGSSVPPGEEVEKEALHLIRSRSGLAPRTLPGLSPNLTSMSRERPVARGALEPRDALADEVEQSVRIEVTG